VTLDVEEELSADIARRDNRPISFAGRPEEGNADALLGWIVADKEANTVESRASKGTCPSLGFASRRHRVDLARNAESASQGVGAIGKPQCSWRRKDREATDAHIIDGDSFVEPLKHLEESPHRFFGEIPGSPRRAKIESAVAAGREPSRPVRSAMDAEEPKLGEQMKNGELCQIARGSSKRSQ
jgi:hypothetical protein